MITLYLMGLKGYNALKELHNSQLLFLVDAVVSDVDVNVIDDYYEEIKDFCCSANLCFYNRKDNYVVSSKYAIAIAWRWLIDCEKTKLIVLHDSLLPKYRGFAPLVNMLIHREPYIGVTALWATEQYDNGDIIDQQKVAVKYPIRISDAIDMLLPLYANITCSIVKQLRDNGKIISVPQDESDATYSLWRDEDDYRIDWNKSSEEILQFVYSVGFPYRGASSLCNGKLVRILDCELFSDIVLVERQVGKVIFVDNGCPVVVCGKGLLKLTSVIIDKDETSLLPIKRFRSRFC